MVVDTQPTNTLEAKMESSIETSIVLGSEYAEAATLVGQDWEQMLLALPSDLDKSAEVSGALRRRRGIRSAADLLRIILAYAVCDWSLRVVGAWCVLMGVADISDVAILNRLCHSHIWLGRLIVQVLARRRVQLVQRPVRLRLVDATVINEPGSCGSTWRLHVSLDLGQQLVDHVELTSAKVGETLAHFPGQPGDIFVADRGYSYANSIEPLLSSQAQVVVRLNWQNTLVQDEEGNKVDVLAWLQRAFADNAMRTQAQSVWVRTSKGRDPLRLVALALPPEAAERARQHKRRRSVKKGETVSARALFACGFILLLTNLPASEWSDEQVLELYRLRWQIELLFKQLKSLLNFSKLRAHDPELAQTYLLGKILALLMLESLTATIATQTPDWFSSLVRPVSTWRLTTLLQTNLRQIVMGVIDRQVIMQCLPQLRRFLCDTPRRRRKQSVTATLLVSRLSAGLFPSPLS